MERQMYGTSNDYEEAIKGARIHAYDNYQKRNSIGKLLSFSVLAVVFAIGFYYSQEYIMGKKSTPNSRLLVNNTQLTQEVLEIGHDEIETTEDEYLTELKTRADESVKKMVQKDDYLLALESMEVDVLDNSQQELLSPSSMSKTIETPNLNQMNLSEAMSNLVDETIADNSNYTNDLKKEVITESKSKGRIIVVKKGDTLESISQEFYGTPMRYKEIMASNSNLLDNSNVIYEGQKITLP